MSQTRRSAHPRVVKTPLERARLAELPVWLISEQCYCEQRVHLWTRKPGSTVSIPKELEGQDGPARALSAAANAGKDFHSALAADAEATSYTALRRRVATGERVTLLESPFRANYGKLPVAGVPDAVTFRNGRVESIIDYKLTDSNQLQMGHRVQLLLYGWLLQRNRFQVLAPMCVSVLVPTQNQHLLGAIESADRTSLAASIAQVAAGVISEDPARVNWYTKQAYISASLWVRLRIFRFDIARARSELRFFSKYWHGQREPIPTSNFKKCSICLYDSIGKCDKSLSRDLLDGDT